MGGVLFCEWWVMSAKLWAVRKAKSLAIGPLVSYNGGILAWGIIILGSNNKKGGEDGQHASLIVSGKQQEMNIMHMTMGIYIFIIYNFS